MRKLLISTGLEPERATIGFSIRYCAATTLGLGLARPIFGFLRVARTAQHFLIAQVRNNVIVDNCNLLVPGRACSTGGYKTEGASLVSIQSNSFVNIAIADNYVDYIGAYYYALAKTGRDVYKSNFVVRQF